MATINYGLNARSTVATGGVAHIIDTTTAFSSGTLVSFRENGTQFAFIDSDGHFNLNDNIRLTLGTGGDADIYYDGTNLNIEADVVGGGVVEFHTAIRPDTNDNATLGISGTAWADLFLASGAVINFNAGDVTLTHSANALAVGGGDLRIGDSASLAIGGDFANANMTTGITIDQGAADDHILAFKSSDVSHGMTTGTLVQDVEVDDYFAISKVDAAGGGIYVQAISETGVAVPHLWETYGGAPATTDTTGSLSTMNWFVAENDGSNGVNDMAANSNAFSWGEINTSSARLTRMLLKADDGELHLGNTTIAQLDEHNDIELIRAMQWEGSGGEGIGMLPLPWLEQAKAKTDRGESLTTEDYGVPLFSHEKLMAIGVLGEKDEDGFCLMRVQPRFAMNEGAIWQNHLAIRETNVALQEELHDVRLEIKNMTKLLNEKN